MPLKIAGMLALPIAATAGAQDLSTATPIAGSWTYAATYDGTEAIFSNATGSPQLMMHCTRVTRRLTISKPATGAAPTITVWTSSLERSMTPSFDAATSRLSVDLANYDPLLDAIVSSRGRVGFTVGVQAPLVVPPWAEPARVIEDCRA